MKNFVNIVDEKNLRIKTFSSLSHFRNKIKDNDIIYTNNFKTKKNYLNFINQYFGNYFDTTVKHLIVGELWLIESFAPGLGDVFLDYLTEYFEKHSDHDAKKSELVLKDFLNEKLSNFSSKVYRLNKKDLNDYVSYISSSTIKDIAKTVIQKSEVNDSIIVEDSFRSYSTVKKTNELFFKLEFDSEFILSNTWNAEDYRYIIIDGFIDSVGEIHHLLQKASEDKEPYVIFCKGMREEVKHTILYNLKRNTINVMPICLKTNEENVNALNDIASCHDGKIISALHGDTISSAVKRELMVGRKISVKKTGFTIHCMNEKTKNIQIGFLKMKLKNLTEKDPNYSFIQKRIKNLNSKKIMISLAKNISKNEKIELDGFLKFVMNAKSGTVKMLNKNKSGTKRGIYSIRELNILFTKLEAVIRTIDSLGCIVYQER